jgi:hypothetical protein
MMNNRNLWILLLGDLFVFLLFAYVGKSSHQMEITLLSIIETAAPFILGWFVVGYFTGIFKPAAYASLGQAIIKVALTWLVAGPIGLVLRAILFQEGFDFTFVIVTMISIAIFMLVWRTIYTLSGRFVR